MGRKEEEVKKELTFLPSLPRVVAPAENNLSFIETSALDANNVESAFQNILGGAFQLSSGSASSRPRPRNETQELILPSPPHIPFHFSLSPCPSKYLSS